jgi:RNA polymerase sigma factor FliA
VKSDTIRPVTGSHANRATQQPTALLEPRYYPRVLLDTDVAVEGEHGSFDARAINVSAGGMAILSNEVVSIGAKLRVAFLLQKGPGRIEVDARVVRVSKAADGGREFALAFDELPDSEEAAIQAFVAESGDIAWDSDGSRIPRHVALHFIPLIRRIARSLGARLPPQVLVDDLIGAGFVALVELWSRAPMASTQELQRLALTRVRYAMLDELRKSDPLTRRERTGARQLEQARVGLHASLGRQPTHAELAEATNTTTDAVASTETLSHRAAPHLELSELQITDSTDPTPEDLASRSEDVQRLGVALQALPPRHRKVLELHYGEHLSMRQVGNLLGVTEARISQLASDAVLKLKASCESSPRNRP